MRRKVADALSEIERRIDTDPVLSDADKETIRAKAREEVAKRKRDAAEAKFLKEAIKDEERRGEPQLQYEDVYIDIAPFVAAEKLGGSCITLDGTMFFHGLTYSVSYAQARSLDDIMARGWEHEREIHGTRRRADFSRRQINQTIRPGNEAPMQHAVNSRQTLRDNTSI